MNLCDDKHDEICYDVRDCPLCELLEVNAALEKDIDRLNKEIDILMEEA